LIPLAVQALKIPVIASGGIADGRGMAAAFALGAQGVNMGTRFFATQEAPVHPNIKKAIVDASERDTKLILRTFKNTSRVLRNEVAEEVVAIENRQGGAKFEDVRPLVMGARGRDTYASGDVNGGVIASGLVVGLINDIPTCEELIQRMVKECRDCLGQAQAWVNA
jgi:nitronate monooxygenase